MRKEWLLFVWVRFDTELKQTVLNSWYVKTMGIWRGVKTGICPFLEIGTKNQNFLENFTSALYLPLWRSYCTIARFILLVSCSQGRIQVGVIGAIAPTKTYASNIFHHDFVQFKKTLGCQQRLGCQILLKSPPLNLRAGSASACSGELAVHSCPLFCLQRQVTKLASGLFYQWSILCSNNMATNLRMFTSSYNIRHFATCDC